MSKASKTQTGAAQTAAPAPEAPRQSAETAAEADLPQTQPDPEPTPAPTPDPEPEAEPEQAPAFNPEGFRDFLAIQPDEVFEAAFEVMMSEAHSRGIIGTEEDAEPVAGEQDPYEAAKQAMEGLDVTEAYVLPDGTWRFSKAAALQAVGNDESQLVVIPNDFNDAE